MAEGSLREKRWFSLCFHAVIFLALTASAARVDDERPRVRSRPGPPGPPSEKGRRSKSLECQKNATLTAKKYLASARHYLEKEEKDQGKKYESQKQTIIADAKAAKAAEITVPLEANVVAAKAAMKQLSAEYNRYDTQVADFQNKQIEAQAEAKGLQRSLLEANVRLSKAKEKADVTHKESKAAQKNEALRLALKFSAAYKKAKSLKKLSEEASLAKERMEEAKQRASEKKSAQGNFTQAEKAVNAATAAVTANIAEAERLRNAAEVAQRAADASVALEEEKQRDADRLDALASRLDTHVIAVAVAPVSDN